MTDNIYSDTSDLWAFQIAQNNEPIATIYPDGLM
jgi:hypothetical protein